MNTTSQRVRAYAGPALFSFGFRPFFLGAAVWAAFAAPIWALAYLGVIPVGFADRDWHVHEMLYGYLPAIITGFLFTAIPNWTGRLPLQGMPLAILVVVWIAGRFAVTFSAATGWWVAMLVDTGFLLLVVAATAREIVAVRTSSRLGSGSDSKIAIARSAVERASSRLPSWRSARARPSSIDESCLPPSDSESASPSA